MIRTGSLLITLPDQSMYFVIHVNLVRYLFNNHEPHTDTIEQKDRPVYPDNFSRGLHGWVIVDSGQLADGIHPHAGGDFCPWG